MKFLLVIPTLFLIISCSTVRSHKVSPVSDLPTFQSADLKAKVYLLLGKEDQFSMNKLVIKAQKRVPEHIHKMADEILFVTKGNAVMTFDGKAFKVKKDDLIIIPKGMKHSFSNGVKTFTAIQLYTPKGPEEKFRKWNQIQL